MLAVSNPSLPLTIALTAAAAEPDAAAWLDEFRWLLAHPALGEVSAGGAAAIAREHAFCLELSHPAELKRAVMLLARRIAPLLSHPGGRVCVDLSRAAAAGASPQALLSALTSLLAPVLRSLGARPGGLAFSITAEITPRWTDLLALSRNGGLGHPQLLVRVPAPETGDRAGQTSWLKLAALAHRDHSICLVQASSTAPACELSVIEQPDAVLPGSCFSVRADTAWLGWRLRCDRLPSGPGSSSELRRLLRALLRCADNLFEQLDWGSAVLLEDAVRNRRLAIRLEGLGNLVDAEAGNPAAPATALRLARRLRLLRNLLRRESASLARERGPFPALDTAPIMAALSQRYGEATARRLIGRRLLRHRHLLAGSPLALLPDCNPRYPRAAYLNLLPALAGVDSLAMYGDSQDLSVTELARTLQLGWAVSVNRR